MNIITSNQLTMSTREIANLLNKNHSDIKRSANRLIEIGAINNGQPLAEREFTTSRGNKFTEYQLCKRDSLVLVAQNSPEFTAAIVDRWQELEAQAQQPAPQLPQNYLEALEQLVEKEKLLIAQAPKVAFVDNLVDRTNLMTATQVASKHKMTAVKLNKFLDEIGGVYSKAVKRGRVFVQPFIEMGLGELKQTELGYSQALFTPAGEIWIHEQLISEGVI